MAAFNGFGALICRDVTRFGLAFYGLVGLGIDHAVGEGALGCPCWKG
jgi:hypothetical protein